MESEARCWRPTRELDCGNSGSTMRMLSGVVAAHPFTSVMIGDASLSKRPMRRVIEPLQKMGARIESHDGCAPLTIHGAKLKAMEYQPPVASAQVKSCVLLAGLFAEGETTVIEPVRTRDHTELALRAFGGEVVRDGERVSVRGGQKLRAVKAYVPGDLSSVTFFLCAAALFPGSKLVVDSVLLNPTRSVVLDVLSGMGVKINFLKVEEQYGELIGTMQAEGGVFQGGVIRGAQSAALIDELPAIAAVAPYSAQGSRDTRCCRVAREGVRPHCRRGSQPARDGRGGGGVSGWNADSRGTKAARRRDREL